MIAASEVPLGILGGTFDPVHHGHVGLARDAGSALRLAAVRFVPAGDPPHRAAPVASAAHRLAMVELALGTEAGFEIDTREISRQGPSYTVLTLTELRAEAPKRPLALIIGADAFLGLPTWHRWRELFGLAHLVVVPRPGVMLDDAVPPALRLEFERRLTPDPRALERSPGGAIVMQPVTARDISASAIRAELARGPAGIAAVRGLLPPTVLAYIDRHQLYRPHP